MNKYFILILLLFSLFSCGNIKNDKIISTDKDIIVDENSIYKKVVDLANEQKYGEAIIVLEKKYKDDPTDIVNNLLYANVVLNMASINGEENKYGEPIIKILNYTLELDPNNSETYRLLGYANEILENYDKAFINYNKSIELDSNNYLAYGNRGHAYGLIGEIDKEEEDLLKGYRINNKIDQIVINLGRLYLIKGDIDKSKFYFNKTLKISKNKRFKSEALYSLGVFSLNEQKYDEAKKYFSLSIDTDPNFEIGYIGLARQQYELYLFQIKNNTDIVNELLVSDSIKNLETAIKLNPKKTIAYYYLALLNMDMGNYGETEYNFKMALDVLNKDITLSRTEKVNMNILISKYYNNEKDN